MELLRQLNNTEDMTEVIIKTKTKLENQKPMKLDFRGSTYRGVSKNKNKWQV
jgi:hypothetical protein